MRTAVTSTDAKLAQGRNYVKQCSRMHPSCVKADPGVFVATLKVCTRTADLKQGKLMHAHAIDTGIESNLVVGNTLLDMYAKNGSLEDAFKVLSLLPNRSVVTWSAMITGCALHGHCQEAFLLFNQMQQEGGQSNQVLLAGILKACSNISTINNGKMFHVYIIECGFEPDAFVGSSLIDMYAKCGSLDEAEEVFNRLQKQDVVTFTAMIGAYANHGCSQKAFCLLCQMKEEAMKPNQVTFLSILKGCSKVRSLHQGKLIHVQIIENELEKEISVGSTLLDMYAKCDSLEDALRVFESLPKRDTVTWDSMIAGCAKHGCGKNALQLFQQMQYDGSKPNQVTFVCILRACSSTADLIDCQLIHICIIESNFDSDLFIGNSLVDVYCNCGSFDDALKVFDDLPRRDVVTWGAMIAGCVQHGYSHGAVQLFELMQDCNEKPDPVIFNSVLKACSGVPSLDQCNWIYALISENGFESNISIGNTLIDMYVKCGNFEDADEVFGRMPTRDVVTWTTMIGGCAQCGLVEESLKMFIQMQQESIKPNQLTFDNILKACSSALVLHLGKLVHVFVIRNSYESDVFITNTLINMYAKCGSLLDACKLFDTSQKGDVVIWNAIIAACAKHGKYNLVRQYFENMQRSLKPDGVTFVSLLHTCSQMGELQQACIYVNLMQEYFGIMPISDHYNCLIDLFGRAGCLDEAEGFLRTLPFAPGIVAWMSLLDHCRTYGHVDLGSTCFDHIINMECRHGAGYILMSDIYISAARQDNAKTLEDVRQLANAWKKPAEAFIFTNDRVDSFIVGGENCSHSEEFFEKLQRMRLCIRKRGYMPCLDLVLQSISNKHYVDM